MSFERVSYQSRLALKRKALDLLQSWQAENARIMVLVSSYDQACEWKRVFAQAGIGFGLGVSSFDSWLADLWELWGDGRRLVNNLQRELMLRRADELCQLGLDTPGYLRLFQRAAREGFAAFEKAGHLGGRAGKLGELFSCYGQLLSQQNLVEATQAQVLLQEVGVLRNWRILSLDVSLTYAQECFLQAAATTALELSWEEESDPACTEELAALQTYLLKPDFDHPIQASGALNFILSSGAYASAKLVAQELLTYFDQHPKAQLALVAPKPQEWFERLAPRLHEAGVSVRLKASMPFAHTAFGQAWCALVQFALQASEGKRPEVRLAADYALSAFSAIPLAAARICDSRFRSSRAQTAEDIYTDLAAFAHEDHRDIMATFAQGDFEAALEATRCWILANLRLSPAEREEALAALSAAVRVHAASAQLGLSLKACLAVLATRRIDLSQELVAKSMAAEERTAEDAAGQLQNAAEQLSQGVGRVEFLSLDDLSKRPPASFDALVFVDLTAENYPLSDERDAADALLDAWGAGRAELEARGATCNKATLMQKTFTLALSCAKDRVFVHRPLAGYKGDEERPSAFFEELIDCYRREPRNADEVDEHTGLTPTLEAFACFAGEEDAQTNLSMGRACALRRSIPVYPTGKVSQKSKEHILLPRILAAGKIATQPYLSPSAIESYLECPQLWFALRRLRLSEIDANFGGLAFGNFAHEVLENFYRLLSETAGQARVSPENLAQCIDLLDRVFDECFEHEQHRFASDALIPLDELEYLEVEQLRDHLHGLLERSAHLLPQFVPYAHEFSFSGAEDEFIYAGVCVAGKVDRIDVDPYGRAVVIDYKGSVGRQYAFRSKRDGEVVLPRKMQTLIYAQMLRRKLGLVPVAALYLSYGKDAQLRGLYDSTVLDPKHDLLGIDPETCATNDFLGVLDAAEEEVAKKIEGLLAGDIAPAAADLKVCEYCPVSICEHRSELSSALQGGAL